jgi:predicted phage terminase large subunit-like protein
VAVATRDPQLVALIAADEQFRRVAERIDAQDSLAGFCERMDPTYARARHADLLIEHLEAVERGDIRRLMVFEPPRHSKTYHVSERFPAWATGRNPKVQGILASYGAELAERNSRVIRNLLRDERWPFPGVGVSEDSGAVNRWSTNHGGIWVAAGVGGAMTGFGADLLLIDDPVKGRAEADSETFRETAWSWYTEVARTRLMPGGRIVVCQTRWHEDDLAGRLLNSNNASQWTVLRLPALADEPDDPLARPMGAALWPEWFGVDALNEIKADLTTEQGARAWQSLYQQRPTADEGGQFKRAWFSERWDTAPPVSLKVMAVDAAFKAGVMNDYSAIVVAGAGENSFPVLDVHQGRWEYPELKRTIVEMYAEWLPHAILIEDTAAGQSVIQELRLSTRHPVIPIKVSASKEARAATVAPVCESGRVLLPRSGRNVGALVDQLAAFPTGLHDDMVDAFVHAVGYLTVATSTERRAKPQGYRVGTKR